LKEETGLDVVDFMDISSPVYSSAGMTDESIVFVYCTCEGDISTEQNTNTEEIEPFWIQRKDIESLMEGSYFEEEVKFCARTYAVLVYNMPS
jgi:ADP-ribose pyrophosphatase